MSEGERAMERGGEGAKGDGAMRRWGEGAKGRWGDKAGTAGGELAAEGLERRGMEVRGVENGKVK